MSGGIDKPARSQPSSGQFGSESSSMRSQGSIAKVKIENEALGIERAAWGGKLEFILTIIGSGIGLGNVWRFPYLLFKSGGGAFLIPFLIMLFFLGIPTFMMEISLGQFCSLSPLNMFKMSPILKGVGYSMIFTNLLVGLTYCVIISWCLYYFFVSFTSQLPWQDCSNDWNSKFCTTTEEFINITKLNESFVIKDGQNISRSLLKTSSEEYFYRKVLQMSEGIDSEGSTVVWELALCLLLVWLIVFFVLLKGVASLGKVVYFTSTFPYLLLTILLVKGAMLEGSSLGISFYMQPDWSKLADPKVWSDAATQIFYSMSSCTGALIAMSSYNQFNNNLPRDAIIAPSVDVLTSIYAGFVIFSVLGYMANMKGVEVKDVAADGPGLVFVVYPEALSLMPVAPLWSILFFLVMLTLGFSSLFTITETFFTAFTDEFPTLLRASRMRTYLFRAVGMSCFYLLSLPMVTNNGFYLFSLLDVYTGGFPLLVIALFEFSLISFVYGCKRFTQDVAMMVGDHKILLLMFRICWGIISPIVIVLSSIATGFAYAPPTLFNKTYVYPGWSEAVGWLVVAFTLCFIPGYALFYMGKDLYKLLTEGLRPTEDWGPFLDKNRTGRYKPLKTADFETQEVFSRDFETDFKKQDVVSTHLAPSAPQLDDAKPVNGGVGMDNKGFNHSTDRVDYF